MLQSIMRTTLLLLLACAAFGAAAVTAQQEYSDFPVSLSELSSSLEAGHGHGQGQGGFFHSLVSGVSHVAKGVAHTAEHVGHDVAHAATAVGHTVKKDAVKVGRTVKKDAVKVGHTVKKDAVKVGHAVKRGAVKVRRTVKKDAKKVGRGVKSVAKKTVGVVRRVGSGVKRVAKKVGGGVKRVAKTVGHDVKSGAKAVGRGVKRVAKTVGHDVKKGAKAIGHGVKVATKAVGHGVAVAAKDTAHGVAVAGEDIGKGVKTVAVTEAHDAVHAYDVSKDDLKNAGTDFKAAFHNGFHAGKLLDAGLDVAEAPGDFVSDEMSSQANHAVAGLHDVGIHNKYLDKGVEIAAQVAGGFIAPESAIVAGIAHSTQNIQSHVQTDGWVKGLENSKMDIANLGLSALAVHGGAGLHSIADDVQISRFTRMSKPIDEEYVQFDRMDHDLEPLDENSDEFKAAVKEQQDYHKTSIKQAFEKSKQDKLAAKKAAPKDIRSRLTRTKLGGTKLGKSIIKAPKNEDDAFKAADKEYSDKLDDKHWEQAQEENKDKWYNKNPVAKKVLTPIRRKVFLSPEVMESTERMDEFGDSVNAYIGNTVAGAAGMDNVVEDKEDHGGLLGDVAKVSALAAKRKAQLDKQAKAKQAAQQKAQAKKVALQHAALDKARAASARKAATSHAKAKKQKPKLSKKQQAAQKAEAAAKKKKAAAAAQQQAAANAEIARQQQLAEAQGLDIDQDAE